MGTEKEREKMSDNAIVKRNGNGTQVAQHIAECIKLMIYNGHKLTDPEAMALAQYAVATDLDPFVGECYYLPAIGPGPGIAGWRKKADEQLNYEREQAHEPLARMWCDYLDPVNGEVGQIEEGDYAVKAILHDTLSKTAWEQRVLKYYIELLKAGEKNWNAARELAGPEPTWSAVGVVRKGENFGRDAMPRYERACKRAEKAAIRKRFPRVHLPEPVGFDESEVIDTQFTETLAQIDSEQAMSDLGYSEDPIPAEHDSNPPIEQDTNYQYDPAIQPVSTGMTIDQARNTKTKDKKFYYALTNEELEWHFRGCVKSLKDDKWTEGERLALELKRDAAAIVYVSRQAQAA
jgi:hypothetical protein